MCGGGGSKVEKPTPPPTANLVPVEATEGVSRMDRMKNYHRNHRPKQGATMLTGDQ